MTGELPVPKSTSSGAAPRDCLKPPPAFAGMRIGLLGGSFNPAHAGHRHLSEVALRRLGLDRIWWLVTPANPLKGRSDLLPFDKRLAIARQVARHPRIDVTAFEAARPDAYTVNTLSFLTRRFPDCRFVWLMGADALVGLHRWHNWRGIAALAPFAVFDRPEYRFAALASRAARTLEPARIDESDAAGLACLGAPAWIFVTMPLSPLSSTQIRAER